jgi:aspartyl-tRNA(Asn)/glutamyl-tRNA(Gln) amidotransferase subunit C
MSHFDENDLAKLMKLSRIDCTEQEKEKFFHSLSRIVSYMDQLNEIHTEGVTPCNHILATLQNVMREDEIKDTLSRETFLGNSPSHVGGMVKVPTVIKTTSS